MSNGRDRQLDGLRAIAVTMVLYAHFFSTNDSYWGHVGVRLFFILSGFLITRLLLDARSAAEFEALPALGSFYIRRALRIFPPYFAMLGCVWLLSLEQSRWVLLWHALYISNFWYALQNDWTPWVLVHTWTLSIEEQFYVVWPLLILLAPRQWIERICIAVIVLSLAYRFYWPFTGTPSAARDVLPPASMDALGAGALLAAYRSHAVGWPQWMRSAWAPLAVAFLLLLSFRSVQLTPTQDWMRWIGMEVFPLVPLVMVVGLCSARIEGYAGRLLEARPLVALGCISYGIYLYHGLVLALVVKAQPWLPVNVAEQGFGRFAIAGAGTLMLASVSWLFFEKPINAFKRHFPYVAQGDRNPTTIFTRWLGNAHDRRSVAVPHGPIERTKAVPDPDTR
ncbi:acyltransferase family protein [Chelativorans salis]|uniref:Acyltransferase n=1 Tax=Chelativorans salis TaxID=2978478 RepID=A0ABT2LHF2_9HYPH|nr:acyltransferase [Chelativorans sp. EGI FJ00035]MCT7373976.1 acyltransferase [Chelativorans sp. EGI FJ00035]